MWLRIQNVLIILCLFFSAYASFASDAINSVALYIVLPIAIVLSIWKNRGIETNRYETILLFLFAWIFYSYLWADYTELASRELHRCLGSILLSLIFAINASEKKMLPWLYLTFLILYLFAWIYANNNIEFALYGTASADGRGLRMNDAKLNANTMAYYTFFASIIVFLFGEIFRERVLLKISRYFFWLLFPLSFFTALVTASREVLIIQIPLLTFMLYYRYWYRVESKYRFFLIIVLTVAFFALSGYVTTIYEDSFLAVRAKKNLTEDTRFFLIKNAIDVGLEYFPIGVGAGNYRMYSGDGHFSHSSYLELFANQGIGGLFLFVLLLGLFIKNQLIRFKYTKDKRYVLFLAFGVVFALDNVFYVFYLDMWLISFFILVATHSELYYRDNPVYIVFENKRK